MDQRGWWNRTPTLSAEGWAFLVRTLAEQHRLCCPDCQEAVTTIDVHRAGITAHPCGHPLQCSAPDKHSSNTS